MGFLDDESIDPREAASMLAQVGNTEGGAQAFVSYCEEHGMTIDDVYELASWMATLLGDMSGAPAILERFKVEMAPGHRRHGDWDGASLGSTESDDGLLDGEVLRNHWFSRTAQTRVHVVWKGNPEHDAWVNDGGGWRRERVEASHDFEVQGYAYRHGAVLEPYRRWDMAMSTMQVGCQAWSADAELTAMGALRALVTDHQWRSYVTTGALIESSRRSRAKYVFRKGRPTVVLLPSNASEDGLFPSCALCLHPLAYYSGTFAGGMCPTDDVIAHLLLMRADEHEFWRCSNQHPLHDRRSGV